MALAFALLLTSACDKNEIVNTENTADKGYALPVTINVSRLDDNPATRATFNDGTKKLAFSTGDKLFVKGSWHEGDYDFAGTLTWVSGGTFSGTITTQTEWTGTVDELLSQDGGASATLLPAGYESYGFLSIEYSGYNACLSENFNNAFATSKASGVEQLSYEYCYNYSSGFTLTPCNAILNFTITGLTASTEVAVVFSYSSTTVSKNVTTNGSGNATFAISVIYGTDLNGCTLTVGGNAITLVSSSKVLAAGKIYNIERSAAPAGNTIDLSTVTVATTAQNGDVLTGTLTNNVKISIADGATVTLDGVSINGTNDYDFSWAGITCEGDATIILKNGTTNTVKGFYDSYPGIYVPENKTLIIQGDGSLTASSNGYGAGIGSGSMSNCGNITIEGGTITATGGYSCAGIGGGYYYSCGNILITSGTINATGGSQAAGIGGGYCADCGNITIANTVTKVTATRGGDGATYSIGAGLEGSCGTVTIGGVVGAISTSPYTYQP